MSRIGLPVLFKMHSLGLALGAMESQIDFSEVIGLAVSTSHLLHLQRNKGKWYKGRFLTHQVWSYTSFVPSPVKTIAIILFQDGMEKVQLDSGLPAD